MKLRKLGTIALAGSLVLGSCEDQKNNGTQELSDDPSLIYEETVNGASQNITSAITEVEYPSKYDNRDRFDENGNLIEKNREKQIESLEKFEEDSITIEENDSIVSDPFQRDFLDENIFYEDTIQNTESLFPRKNIGIIKENIKNAVFITIDDGPGAYTKEIAEELYKRGHRATFFWVGNNINENRYEAMRRAEELGHELGNHSFSHQNFKKLSLEKAKEELEKTEKGIKSAGVNPAPYFRFPYGKTLSKDNPFNEYIKGIGYEEVFWTIDTRDWSKSTTKKDLINCLEKVKPGDIILIHERSYTKDKIIPVIDSVLKEKNLISVPYRKK